MLRKNPNLQTLLSFALAISILPFHQTANGQDLVTSEDLAGGSSVFVFRESRKKSQSRAAGGSVTLAGGGRASAARSNSQIASAAQKRRTTAVAARKQEARASANRKIALSNTLTAKAETFLDSGQTDSAITNYRDALVQNPNNTRASDGLSNALTAKGIETAGDTNSDSAIVYFDEAAKLDKQNDVAYAKLGAIYGAKGDNEKAISNYEQAVGINPDYTMLYTPLGLSWLAKGEVARAEIYSQKSETAGIDNIDTRYLRGLVTFRQNKNEESLAAFTRVLELDPRFAEALLHKGLILDRMGQPDQAIASFKKALETEPANSRASFELGVAYYNKADYNNAAVAYQDTVKREPDNYQAHANLASTYRQLERFAEANTEYSIASIGIKTADLYSEWGYCLGKANEWENSVARLSTAKEMSPTAIDNSNLGWAHYNAASEQTAKKDPEGAKKNYSLAKSYLEVAVQQDPKLDAAYLNLGSTHNGLGEFQAAVAILKTVLGFRSDWAIASNQLGRGYRGLNDLVNAVATFKRVVDLDSRNTFGLFSLGEAYNASGNKKEAKKVNDQLKKLDPALAARLDNIFSGKIVDATKQIERKIPKIPKFP